MEIKIRFPARPGWEILSAVKSAGFRWNGSAWTAPATSETEAVARKAKAQWHAIVTQSDAEQWDLDYALGY